MGRKINHQILLCHLLLFIAKGNSPPRAEGQRWEAQWAAEQCLETGGMMFERSEFLPPQALRQAASGEVRTDWRILQQLMLMQFVNKGSTECRTRLPRFWYFFKKVQKERLEENTSEQLRLRTAVEFNGERKRVFAPYSLPVSPKLRLTKKQIATFCDCTIFNITILILKY